MSSPSVGPADALFADFTAAAGVEQSRDELDQIEVFVRNGLAVIDTVAQVTAGFHKACGDEVFYESCDAGAMTDALWGEACERVASRYVRPEGVDIGDIHVQIAKALGFRGSTSQLERRSEPEVRTLLPKWRAGAIRAYLSRLIGDPRETRIRQLRDAVLKAMSGDRPAERFRWRCGTHHRDHHLSGRLALPFNDSTTRDVVRFVIYVTHLATGKDPKDIEQPVIPCLSDDKEPWERTQVYRRVKDLAPGIKAFRFTAGSAIEVDLHPAILHRFQAEWDARWPADR